MTPYSGEERSKKKQKEAKEHGKRWWEILFEKEKEKKRSLVKPISTFWRAAQIDVRPLLKRVDTGQGCAMPEPGQNRQRRGPKEQVRATYAGRGSGTNSLAGGRGKTISRFVAMA